MSKQTLGGVSSLFQHFQEAGQLASEVRPVDQFSDRQFGPEHQLAALDNQIRFAELEPSQASDLGPVISVTPGAIESDLGLEWVQDYIKTPIGSLDRLKSNQVVKLRYYLDPQVQDIIESGNATTILNLFVAKHPRLLDESQSHNDFGPEVLKFLKMVLLDSNQGQNPQAGQIISSPTIADLRETSDNFFHRHGFGEVVNTALSALYDKYHQPNCQPSNALEDKIFRTFELWQDYSLDQLHELRNSFESLSTLTWGRADLACPVRQQVVDFLILLHGPGSFPDWGQGESSPASDEFQLRRFSQDPKVNVEARGIAQHILRLLPQSFNNGLYRDLILIAKRLQVEPVENITTFLNEQGIDLGQSRIRLTANKQTKSTPKLLHQLTAAETQQLQLYLKPEVQALIHSAEGRQLAEDFIAGRIVNPQALPPGSLDLIRFLVGEVQLRANPTTKSNLAFGYQNLKGQDIDRNSQLWRDRDFFLLRQVCADMEACGVAVKKYFTTPLKPESGHAYQRWRDDRELPGDEYLAPYFDHYAAMPDSDLVKTYCELKNQSKCLDDDFIIFFASSWLYLDPSKPDYYDPVRQTILDKVAKTTTVFATQLLAKELFKVMPHNLDTPMYKLWAKLVTGLGTAQGNLELNAILNKATATTTQTKVTPMPLAPPVATGYAEVVASRQFNQCYQDFLTAPNKSKAKLLTQKLAGMKRLILTRPLAAASETAGSPAGEYEQLNKALEGIEKAYVSERKAQM